MRPRTFSSAAIARNSNTTGYSTRRLWFSVRRFPFRSTLVLHSNAFDVVAFQITADSFGLILGVDRKAGPIIRGAVLHSRLGEGIGVGQQFQCLDLHHAEAPLGLVLVWIGANLNDPPSPPGGGRAAGGGAGVCGGVARDTLAGKTPSTPGRAPGGGGGSASPAGTAAAVRAGSVRVGSERAVSTCAASPRAVSLLAVSC